MRITYEDEYGNILLDSDMDYVASIGDSVVLGGEVYRVKTREFEPEENKIAVIVTQGSIKQPVAESKDAGRHVQLHNAIVELNKRQDLSEKNHRALTDNLSSVKQSVNRQFKELKQPKKE